MQHLKLLVVLGLLACLGCGAREAKGPAPAASMDRPANMDQMDARQPGADGRRGDAEKPRNAANHKADQEKPGEAFARKIIYTAHVDLVVEDFEAAEGALVQLIRSHKDVYIAKSDVRGSPGDPRTATWTIRVPAAQYEAFLDEVVKLGELHQKNINSQDATDEYYDTKSRVKNKQVEEVRLLKHLEQSTGKLEDILAVERELTRVRGEIERMQGRLQYLEQLSALTTVTVTLHARKGYVPPQAPSFGTSISRTFGGSVDALASLGKGLVLLVVALTPWLPVVAVAVAPVWWLGRRYRRQLPATVTPAPPVNPS